MTWPALLLLLTTPTQVADLPSPVLTMAQGTVAAEFEGQTRALERRSILSVGSLIETGSQSTAAIYWQPGLVIYLGQDTKLQLSGTSELPDIQLLQGNIRTVTRTGAIVQTPGTATRIGHGIVRHSVNGSVARVACESGTVRTIALHSESGPLHRSVTANGVGHVQQVSTNSRGMSRDVAPGEQIFHDTINGFLLDLPSSGLAERLDVERIQMETVAQVSRAQRGAAVPAAPPLPEESGSKSTKEDEEEKKKREDEKLPKTQSETMPNDDATRGLADLLPPDLEDIPEPDADNSGGVNTQVALGTSGINLALGNVSLSTAAGGAGGLFTDANQATNAGMLTAAGAGLAAGANFPGNIHPVTSETVHSFADVSVVFSDGFPLFRQFWSIGIGTPPTGQVTTGVNTGTSATPEAVAIPQFNAYIVRLDQYGLTDPASAAAAGDTSVSISGLVGANPQNPNIQGATPLVDERAEINNRLTFALGELAVDLNGTTPQLVVRRSDQDRMIVKDSGGNDANDQVTINTQVTEFVDKADPLFFPSNPTVKVPGRGTDLLTNQPSYRTLDPLRKAAATTLMADQLFEYARRTGQTRFVIDGKILDISGYQGR
jgi:hypothetical protein